MDRSQVLLIGLGGLYNGMTHDGLYKGMFPWEPWMRDTCMRDTP